MFEIKSPDGSQTVYINPSQVVVQIPSPLAPGDGKCRVFAGTLIIEVTADVAKQIVASQGEITRPHELMVQH